MTMAITSGPHDHFKGSRGSVGLCQILLDWDKVRVVRVETKTEVKPFHTINFKLQSSSSDPLVIISSPLVEVIPSFVYGDYPMQLV